MARLEYDPARGSRLNATFPNGQDVSLVCGGIGNTGDSNSSAFAGAAEVKMGTEERSCSAALRVVSESKLDVP